MTHLTIRIFKSVSNTYTDKIKYCENVYFSVNIIHTTINISNIKIIERILLQ